MANALNWIDGEWIEGNPAIIGPMTNASWMSTVVFDGARYFDGNAPDLDLHCERCVASARSLGLEPEIDAKRIAQIAIEGVEKFPAETALYIRPMFYGDGEWLLPDATRFVLTLIERPMPAPEGGISVCRTSRVRPSPLAAPTDAKAACLYPNVHRMIREAAARGYDAAVVGDANGNVAELSTSNIFIAKDGVVATPVPNGSFLNGITRQRTIQLLREAGVTVEERTITFEELETADEIFATGNASKVQAVIRYEARDLQPGPLAGKAQRRYAEYSKSHGALDRFR